MLLRYTEANLASCMEKLNLLMLLFLVEETLDCVYSFFLNFYLPFTFCLLIISLGTKQFRTNFAVSISARESQDVFGF